MQLESRELCQETSKKEGKKNSQRPACFFIVSRVPFPPVGGDKLKYFNMIEILKTRFKINVLIITDEQFTKEMKEYLDASVDEYKVFRYSKLRFMYNAVKTFFSSKPLQVGYYYFEEVNQYFFNRIKPEDFVMSNLIRTALYVENLGNKKFIDIADSIYLNYIRSIDGVNSLFWRIVYKIEIKRLHAFEKSCVSKFDASLFANSDERDYYKNFGNATWIPNGVNQKLIDKQYQRKRKILFPEVVFFGKMNYQPNIDAVIWLVNKVLPLIPSMVIRVIGGSPTTQIKKLGKKYPDSLIIEGYLEDPYQLMYEATAVVAPMQTGGGIQNKILEAMAIGAVVLTTSLGAKPIIGASDGQHLIICNKPEDYAEIISKIHKDMQHYSPIGGRAKKLMSEKFTWRLYAQKLFEVLDEINYSKNSRNNKVTEV